MSEVTVSLSQHHWQTKPPMKGLLSTQMNNSIQEAHPQLSESEIEIERLKKQLETEKQATIELVHLKTTNTKKDKQLTEGRANTQKILI